MLRASLAVSAALGLALSAPALGGGFGIPEVGVRRTGMGAIVGRPDDPSAMYHNPAGLVLADEWQLYISLGGSLLDTKFQLHSWDQSDKFLGVTAGADGYYNAVKPTRAYGVIPMVAAVGPIWRHKLYGGVAAFVGNATGAAFSSTAVTRYHLIDGYVVAPQVVIGAAYKVTDTLAFGATAGVVNIRIHGKENVFPIVNGQDISSLVGSSPLLELDASGWAPTWQLGVFGHPIPRLTWGASLVGKIDATLTGPIKVTYSDDAPTPGDTLQGQQTTKELLPWALYVGANFDVTPQIELGAEGRYWLYRQLQEQHTDIVGIFLLRSLDSPKDYHDSWEASGGLRVHDLAALPKVDLMAGLQYDYSPAPSETVSFQTPSFTHWGLHSGVRYSFGRWRLGASYIHYWYEIPTVTDSITSPPTNFRGSGSNNIATLSVEVKL